MAKKSKKKTSKKKVEKEEGIIEKIEEFGEELSENTEKQDKELHVGKKLRDRENKQLFWFFAIIILVFASFLGTYFYFQGLKTFNFAGVDWVKEDYENLELYHARFPIVYQDRVTANYNLYLRNDPRENNVSVITGIKMKFWPHVIISNSPDAAACPAAGRMTGDLGMFLSAFPWIGNITGAVDNQTVAEKNNIAFANCTTAMQDFNKTVVLIKTGEYPHILKEENANCYVVYTGECENVLAIERFMIEILNHMPTGTKIS
ncbi:hypothetical protein CMI37_26520 [Candidatus Pacearchaeota archaeon]|nr:hypothetical protein [Candidatus Pacearchaeota archaeon]|tara:strand:- start:4880 stop:5662 length:783 start_codon:yes stop_codon:yes gene_type:complete